MNDLYRDLFRRAGPLCLGIFLNGCGAGIVGAILGGSKLAENGGPSEVNGPTLVSDVRLTGTRVSPGVSFLLTDRESDPADVEVSVRPGAGNVGGKPRSGRIAHLKGISTSPTGVRNEVAWDYTAVLGSGYSPGLEISVAVAGGEAVVLEAQAVGNDPPEISEVKIPPEEEVVGIAKLGLTVSDSSEDLVSIRPYYRLSGADQADWSPATLAGGQISNLQAPRQGRRLDVLWDVKADLGAVEGQVVLRFIPTDGEEGEPVDTEPFFLDTDQPPEARLLAADFVRNPDQRRGIPIPFEVRDPEGGEVRVFFQWRLSGEPFPELPAERRMVEALLENPALRREKHIATERPVAFEGGLVTVIAPDDSEQGKRVRLPELASTASSLLAGDLLGKEVEVLRRSRVPREVGQDWDLRLPRAALPLDDGTRALVLDSPSSGFFRLREIDLASGEVLKSHTTSGAGDPTALAIESGGRTALVAVDPSDWKLLRVSLGGGQTDRLTSGRDSGEPGPLRCLLALGPKTALATAASAVLRIDTANPGNPLVSAILGDLKTPWGIARNPTSPGRVYLSERDFEGQGSPGRILELNVVTLERRTVAGGGLPRPEAIASDPSGRRLFALTDPTGEGRLELRALELAPGGEAVRIVGPFEGPAGTLAAGRDSFVVLALPALNRLAVGGGVEMRRTITAFEVALKEATLDRPFDPAPENDRQFRIVDRLRPFHADPRGTRRVFVWDSGDVPAGGEVDLRVVPFDTDVGTPGDAAVLRPVKGIFEAASTELGGENWTYLPQSSAAGDLNGDSLLDLVSSNDSSLAVFLQKEPLVFQAAPDQSLPGLSGGNAVAAADLDGDGLTDVVAADSRSLLFWFQTSPGGLAGAPELTIPGIAKPRSIAIGDLDADGDLDLVTADSEGNSLSVFARTGKGSRYFERKAILLPAPPGTPSDPSSVALGDFDGDGRTDVASACEALDVLAVFIQGEVGSFPQSPALTLGKGSLILAPESVAAADLNGDGLVDLASANQLSGNLALFFQGAGGTFSPAPQTTLEGLGEPRSIAAADLNRDGALDLVSVNLEGGDLTGFLQNAPGHFGPGPDLKLAVTGTSSSSRPVSVLSVDLDGDGTPELVSTNALGNDLRVFAFTAGGGGKFSSTPDLILGGPQLTAGPFSIAAGDLDGDGDLDLLSANQAGNDLTVLIQTSTGSFEGRQSLKFNGTGGFSPSVVALDMDGDGRLEAVHRRGSRIEVFFQERPGVFEEQASLVPGPIDGNGQILSSDLDRDGLPDLAVVNSDYLSVLFQENQREYSVSAPGMKIPRDTTQGGPWTLTVGDFDGDGDLDLASANSGGSPLVTIFFQRGDREFPAAPDLEIGGKFVDEGLVPIGAGDLDGDGALDLVMATHREVNVFYQKAAPVSFEAGPDLTLGGRGLTDYPAWVALGDLDGDGDLDLVSANQLGNSLTVFFQDSTGGFPKTPDRILGGIDGPTCALASDLDGDGDLDLISTSSSGNSLAVFYGSH
jgi:hypothetical protein